MEFQLAGKNRRGQSSIALATRHCEKRCEYIPRFHSQSAEIIVGPTKDFEPVGSPDAVLG